MYLKKNHPDRKFLVECYMLEIKWALKDVDLTEVEKELIVASEQQKYWLDCLRDVSGIAWKFVEDNGGTIG